MEEREAKEYDEAAVKKSRLSGQGKTRVCGCPGAQSKAILRGNGREAVRPDTGENPSRLSQWPVQIRLAPVSAPFVLQAGAILNLLKTEF